MIKRICKTQLFAQFLSYTNAATIHCIGDSHIGIFAYIAWQYFWWHTRFKFCLVEGGTAMGLANPNSQTQALPIFTQYLKEASQKDSLLFCLGEVDCGFVIWYRAQKYGLSVEEQFMRSLHNYCAFLDYVIQQGFTKIIVASVPLPTIIDNQNWGQVARLRSEVKASLKARTELTIKYNQELRQYCHLRNLTFLDYELDILDQNQGLIKDCFRHCDPLNHHLNEQNIAPVIVPKLKALGYW